MMAILNIHKEIIATDKIRDNDRQGWVPQEYS